MNKTGILIQARLSSSRFPRKMLDEICGFRLCEYVYNRCRMSKLDLVAVITSNDASDDELASFCDSRGIPVFRGDLNNVLDRYIKAADYFGLENIIRVCGDSPFVDIDLIDEIIQLALNRGFEYCAVVDCLNGFMSEFVELGTLKQIALMADLSMEDKEHVTKYIRDRVDMFKSGFMEANLRPKELERYTLTVDYPVDIEIARKVCKDLKGFDFKSTEILEILQKIEG
ncbi:MAG: hypothetical protein PHE67_01425 [Campylobacterales bacterium]|nr:hypothetical protein [Campylobacterales bacterium]